MTKRMLIIVDPQNDFITGSLAVVGAEEAMTRLCDYLCEHSDRYDIIIVTADRHPLNHCSFETNGGQWPVHCVKDTSGAAIYAPLAAKLSGYPAETIIIGKGMRHDREEYSVFTAPEYSEIIEQLVKQHGISEIDVCGIAGDYCVLATVADGIERFGHEPFRVLLPYSPSIDGGARLAEFIKENNLKQLCVK